MTTALSNVAALVWDESGIRLAERQYPFLQAALDRMGTGSEPELFLRRAADPLQRTQLVARLIEEVTVKETSFLRDREQLAKLDWRLLLKQARARGGDHVRVWSAPCATGEEAYSLAVLACEALHSMLPPVRILATDISADALDRARRGIYGARSAAALDSGLRKRHFRERSAGLAVGEQLRALVTFAQHNLTRDPFPPLGEAPFDLILCRNVLIYFDGQTIGRLLTCFQSALAPSGQLVLGAADVLCASASRLAETPARVPPADPPARRRRLRRPLGRSPAAAPVGEVTDRVPPADLGSCESIIAAASRLIAEDPLNASAYFQRGLAELESDDPAAAVNSLRRALYVEPQFGLAAFKLGGAHEARGDLPAARRAYEQALRTLGPHACHEPFLAQIELADVATAARSRLGFLAAAAG